MALYALPIDEQGISRRWDPTGIEHDGEITLVCLAAAYNGGERWWSQPNRFELWRGRELVQTMDIGGMLTAAHLFEHDGVYYLYYGRQHGFMKSSTWLTPDQRLYYATSTDLLNWEWDKEVGITPPARYAYKGFYACRDPYVTRLLNGQWALFVSTGGVRWGTVPQVLLYLSSEPTGPWALAGECLDQKTAQCYGEFERPFVTVEGEQLFVAWSAWEPMNFFARGDYVWHIASRRLDEQDCALRCIIKIGLYGMQKIGNKVLGWRWEDRKRWIATCYVGDINWDFKSLPKVTYWA